MFIWRACNEILPTLHKLMKRRLTNKDYCPICLHHPKTVIHVLWGCEAARDVRCQSSRSLQRMANSIPCFFDLWMYLAASLNQEALEEMALISNLIWERCNNYVFNHQFSHPNSITKRAQSDLHLLSSIQSPRQDRCGHQPEVLLW